MQLFFPNFTRKAAYLSLIPIGTWVLCLELYPALISLICFVHIYRLQEGRFYFNSPTLYYICLSCFQC